MLTNRLGRAAALGASLCLLPAAAAWADCQTDFTRDNRVKAEAGPFKAVEERVPMSKMDDGSWVMSLRQGKVTSVTEAVPASKAFRYTTDAPLSGNIVMVGQRGWQQDGADGAWAALDADDVKTLAGALDEYFGTEELADLTCSAEDQGGRAVRLYRFTAAGNPFTGRNTITAQFDAKTGLPLSATYEAAGSKNKVSGTTTFTFDRKIQVKRPAGVGKS